ncbi:MAG: DNA mismatch repair protein MutS [Methanotrichaceae archaeon]
MARISPLMEQYYKLKEQCGDAILLFRMGDFYETFGEDAEVTASELNITLTSRQKDNEGNKIPLAGIPHHALEAYLPKLVIAGHKVAICEQMEDPKKAKGLVKREVTRIITPGTIIEPSMLEEGANNFLASVVEEKGSLGLAFVDVSTGEFLTTEISDSGTEKKLDSELAKFRPAECIVPQSAAETVLDLIGNERMAIQNLEDDVFDFEDAHKLLQDHFGQKALDQSGIEAKKLSIRASGAVLSYLRSTHLDALDYISSIKLYSASEFMVLDEITQRNLELFRNIRDRSKRGTLLEFLDKTSTPMGSRALRKWLQMPTLSVEEIESRLNAVEELFGNSLLRTDLREDLKGLGDLERTIARTSCGTASPKDLTALRTSLELLPRLYQILEEVRSSRLKDLRSRSQLEGLIEIVKLIKRSIQDDPPATIREGGIIRDGYDKELDELRTILREGRGWITRLQNEERKRTGIKSLKIGYNNVFGYYIEITRSNLSSVPEEYIRKQTLSNSERYITPELKEMEAKVLSAQERSTALEQELFVRIRTETGKYAKEIQKRAVALGELDVLSTLALVAAENGFVKPQLNSEESITIRDSRHPILDKYMRGKFVPNDVYLDGKENRFLILTGPNMAGKSTYMRQIALSQILAQIGSFVPASFASMGLVDRIFTRVGAYDDLTAGQSTFMIEMTELANILNSATPRSLILLDEIGRGTSTFDGLSIAWAISEYLHNKVKGKTVFATHYHQLTQLNEILPGVKNYNMAVKEDGDSVVFLRTVVPGATNKSYGIHVAKLAGVPSIVVTRAKEILKAIETETVIEPLNNDSKSKKKTPKYTQLMFFDAPQKKEAQPVFDPLLEEIKDLDLNSLAPIEALNKLVEYQKSLKDKDAQNKVA